MCFHNIIRTNKEHRTLALNDFKDQDIKALLERPVFFQTKRHEKEALQFFCKDCKVPICNTCIVTLHEGHGKMPLEEATYARTTEISSVIQSLKDKILAKRKKLEQYNQQSVEVLLQVSDVKDEVQEKVDIILALTELKKEDVFGTVDAQTKKSLEVLSRKKGEVENQTKVLESVIEETESLFETKLQ